MKTPYPAIVGRVIRQRRGRLGIQQGEFADKMGLSQAAWSRTERGHSALTLVQLVAAADILGVPASDLCREAERLQIALREVAWDLNKLRALPDGPDKEILAGVFLAFVTAPPE